LPAIVAILRQWLVAKYSPPCFSMLAVGSPAFKSIGAFAFISATQWCLFFATLPACEIARFRSFMGCHVSNQEQFLVFFCLHSASFVAHSFNFNPIK